MDQPVMTFDLPGILADLKREPTWQTARRNAVTLLKQPGLRVVLIALRGGTGRQIASHQTDSPVTIQSLEGRITVRTDEADVVLTAGHLLTLRPGLKHSVGAEEDAAFLLTLASDALHPVEAST